MASVFEINIKDIPDDAAPRVVEKWDSLRHMNLVLALEEEFKIRFLDEQIEQLMNIEQIELSINEFVK